MKKLIAFMLLAGLLTLGACGEEEKTTKDVKESQAAPAVSVEESSDVPQLQESSEARVTENALSKPSLKENELFMYYPDDGYNLFAAKVVEYDGTPKGIIDVMITEGVLPPSTELISWKVEDGTGLLDMNKDFETDVSAGSTYEAFTMGCLINTFIDCYGVEEILLTCEGKTFNTAHVGSYDWPLTKYYDQ